MHILSTNSKQAEIVIDFLLENEIKNPIKWVIENCLDISPDSGVYTDLLLDTWYSKVSWGK